MAHTLTRTKKIITQEHGVRSEEVKLSSANPTTAPLALLFEVAPGKASSSIPSLVPWTLPSFSRTFLHFSTPPPPPLAPSPLLLCPLPLALPRRRCSSGTLQQGMRAGMQPPLPAMLTCLFSLSHHPAEVPALASPWSLRDGKCSVDRSNRLEIAWGRCCCEA